MFCTEADTERLYQAIRDAHIIAVDTETTGLEFSDRLFGVSIATSTEEFYVEHPGVIAGLPLRGKELVFCNAKFDMHKLHFAGVNFEDATIRDISIFERILDNDKMSIAFSI